MGSRRGKGSAIALAVVALTVGCGRGPDTIEEETGRVDGVVPDASGAPDASAPPDASESPDASGPGDASEPPDSGLPPGPCQPTAGGPYWLTEGEHLEVTLRCSTGLALPEETSVEGMPRGMRFDAARATLSWTPGLDQAAVWKVSISAGPNDPGSLTIGVADAFWQSGNTDVTDPATYTEEFGVPVIFVSFSGTPTKETPLPAQVTYRGRTWTTAEVKLHGATSLDFPKVSYGLRFPSAEPFGDADRAFVGRTKIRLTQTFDDNTYVRQRLAYTLWNRMDPRHVQVGIYSAVVFLNGKYWGLYELSDDVDKGLLRLSGLNKDGNLYKALTSEANFYPWAPATELPKTTPHQGFEKKEGLPPQGFPGDFDDLDAFLTWLYTADTASFRAGFSARTMQSEFEDFWMFVCTLLAGDNARKNYYLFHDPAGGPWRYIPWDLNATLGQSYQTLRKPPELVTFTKENGLFERFLSDPVFADPLQARFGRVLRAEWELGKVLALWDGMTAEIRGAALRDERKWSAAYRSYWDWRDRTDFQDHVGEVAYVRGWLVQQWGLLTGRYR